MELPERSHINTSVSLPIKVGAIAVGLMAVSVLVGWQFDIEWLKRPIPRTVAMNPATAVCFLVSVSGMLSVERTKWVRAAALFLLVFSVVKLISVFTGITIPIDTFLFSGRLDTDVHHGLTNSMAPNTAFGFLLVGLALFQRSLKQTRKWLIEVTVLLAFMQGGVSVIGYAYQVPEFYGVLSMFPMAIHTAVGFCILACSLLFIQPFGPFMRTMTATGSGGLMARVLLPLAAVLSFGLGALRLYGERGHFYSGSFGLMMHVVLVIILFGGIIWWLANIINRKDAKQRETEEKLAKLNAELEERVEDRTKRLMGVSLELEENAARLHQKMEELAASEERFHQAMDNMLEGVQIIGFDWRYKYVNKALTKHGKYTEKELIGRTMMEMYPRIETTEVFRVIKNCMDDRKTHHLENFFSYPDGTAAWFELSIQPIPEGVFILSIDITDRKKAENELLVLNASLERTVENRTAELQATNKELESFSYSVSHDLRAPLRAVNGFSKMLEQQYGPVLDNNGKRLLSIISTNASTMGQLIDDLLAFSRTGRAQVEKTDVDMNELVAKVFEELSEQVATRMEFIETDHLNPAFCDHNMIKQVWTNLISNAIKYSANRPDPQIRIWSDRNDRHITYHIQDNGVGFDMAYSNKLFGVFQRLHSKNEFEGTGVGLALVYRIIVKHGGKVWAEAEVDNGATFHFTLPIKPTKTTPRTFKSSKDHENQNS